MALTLIRNRFLSVEDIARRPRRVRGGWIFRYPPDHLWRYNAHARRQALQEWGLYGANALALLVGGGFGMPQMPPAVGALVADGPFVFPYILGSCIGAPGTNGATLDAAGEYQTTIVRVTKTGSLSGFGFLSGTSAGSPTCDMEFQSVGADGLQSGTVLGATNNAKATGVSVASNTWTAPAFGEVAAVTQGDLIAVVVRYAAGTSLQVRANNTNFRAYGGNTYAVSNTTGSAVKALAPAAVALAYNDGSYMRLPGTFPTTNATYSETMASGGVNHKGNVYTNPSPKRAMGGVILLPSTTLDYTGVIATDAWDGTADNDGSSNIAVAIDNDQTVELGAGYTLFWLSSASLAMVAGTDYRTLIKATDASNITIYELNFNAAAIQDSQEGGQAFRWTQATNPTGAGDWTDTATKRAFTGFWFDQIDDGVQTGGSGGFFIQ